MIKYDHGRIDMLVADLHQGANRLGELRADLHHSLAGLRNHWQGSGNASWEAKQQKWDGQFSDSSDLLNRLANAVAQANDAMRRADVQSARSFGA